MLLGLGWNGIQTYRLIWGELTSSLGSVPQAVNVVCVLCQRPHLLNVQFSQGTSLGH